MEEPHNTLATQEMSDYRASSILVVGRDINGKKAHIYYDWATESLCGRHHRVLSYALRPYVAGDKTCKLCLKQYRTKWKQRTG